MMKFLKKPSLIYLIIPLVCLFFYLGLVKAGHKHVDLEPDLNYFRYLADAFLNGHLNINNPPLAYDLVQYNGQYYLYWPPAPALIYMPLVAFFGLNLPDTLINAILGIANVWLIMKIAFELSKKFSLNLTNKQVACIGIFWGLGTVQFYMCREGSVWFVSQIMAQTFLFSSVYFFVRENSKIIRSLILSGLFFALMAYTRNNLVFAGFFFIFLYIAMNRDLKTKTLLLHGTVFISPFILCSLLNGWYNYARFGNFFENGIKYHSMAGYFLENYKNHGYFSWHYIPYNFYVEVLHFPTFTLQAPFIQEEPEGFGFIWGSPAFLLLIPAFYLWAKNRKGNNEFNLIKMGSLITAVLIALLIFSIMGTGWKQFCARYTLDFQFFLVIFLLFSWKDLIKISYIRPIAVCLILISFVVQYIGSLMNF